MWESLGQDKKKNVFKSLPMTKFLKSLLRCGVAVFIDQNVVLYQWLAGRDSGKTFTECFYCLWVSCGAPPPPSDDFFFLSSSCQTRLIKAI